MRFYENNTYLEHLGYTYDEWKDKYFKEMSSGLSVGCISGGRHTGHYYLKIVGLVRFVIGDETMAKLNADFKELKDDFNAYMNYLK